MSSSTRVSRDTVRRVAIDVALFAACLIVFDRALMALVVVAETRAHRVLPIEARLQAERRNGVYQLLLLGTSRTYQALLVAEIESGTGLKTWKETGSGKGPRYYRLFYDHFARVMGPPRAVVIGADYFLGQTKTKTGYLERFPETAGRQPAEGGPLLLVGNKRRIDELVTEVLDNPDDDQDLTDPPQSAMARYRGRTAPGRVNPTVPERHLTLGFGFPGKEGTYLLELIERCRDDGVPVVLVGLPEYIGTYRTNFEQAAYDRHYRAIAGRYPNVRFFNYNDPAVFPLDRADLFYDGAYGRTNSHLRSPGAVMLTGMLLKDLEHVLRTTHGE